MSVVAIRIVLVLGCYISLLLISVRAQFCGKPGVPYDGRFNPLKSQYNVSDGVVYSCEKETLSLVGAKIRRCLLNETWEHPIPTCEKNIAYRKPTIPSSPNLVDNNKQTFQKLLNERTIQIDLQEEQDISFVILSLNPNVRYSFQIDIITQQQSKRQCNVINNKILNEMDNTFVCNSGYPLRGRYVAITEQSKFINEIIIYEVAVFPTTVGNICGDPDVPSHGSVVRNDNKAEFSCEENYLLQGETTSWCVNGKWNRTGQFCILKPKDWTGCGEPGTPNNGDRFIGGDLQNLSVYSCYKGAILIGESKRACLPNGTWSPQQIPRCVTNLAYNKLAQHQPSTIPKHSKSIDGDDRTFESQKEGFYGFIDLESAIPFNKANIFIRSRNNMSIAVYVTNDTRVMQRGFNDPKTLTHFCNSNYVIPTAPFTCTHDEVVAKFVVIYLDKAADVYEIGVSNSKEKTPCGQPDQPLNGRMKSRTPYETTYECDHGFTLKGASSIRCVDGVWNSNHPLCELITTSTTTRRTSDKPTDATSRRTSDYPTAATTTSHNSHEGNNDSVAMGIMGIAVGATAACVAIILVSVLVYCFVRKHYKNRSRCDHDHSSRGSRSDCYTTTYRLPDRRRDEDDDVSIHLYDSIKEPNYSFTPRRLPDTVSNDMYDAGTLNSNHSSEQRHRLLPERPPLYDSVTPELDPTQNDNKVKLTIPEGDDPLLDCENKPITSL
ncbi:hypothetical protein CHUAL_006882 [Chamberlinius hualienensis]